jgi:ATP-dependent DNA helicase RecG
MKNWLSIAMDFLKASLEPPRHELNELDWKAALSPDKKRLSEHLSALANLPGGGFLVFGVNNAGMAIGVDEATIETTINKLANIGRDALEPPISLDHAVETFGTARVLFVHVPESAVKPVHLRGKSLEHAFIRSGGTTRMASRQEIGVMMLHSRTPRWEELHASVLLSDEEMMERLNVEPILKMLERPLPTSDAETMIWMAGENFVERVPSGGGYVTNLGAVAAASKLEDFPDLSRKAVRIVVYDGPNKTMTKREKEGTKGYGSVSKES